MSHLHPFARPAVLERRHRPGTRRYRHPGRRAARREPPPGPDGGQRLAVDLVRVEPAQFLGQQFRDLPPLQRDVALGLAGPGQRRHPAVWPADDDVTGVVRMRTSVIPGPPEVSRVKSPEPAASQASAGRRSGSAPRRSPCRPDRVLFLIDGRGQQRSPWRRPGPAQVGVAWLVAGRSAASASAGASARPRRSPAAGRAGRAAERPAPPGLARATR